MKTHRAIVQNSRCGPLSIKEVGPLEITPSSIVVRTEAVAINVSIYELCIME
jgi:hypothetical protein